MAELGVNSKIAILGAGSMSEAMLRGWLGKSIVRAQHVAVLNRQNTQRLQEWEQSYKIHGCYDHQQKSAAIQAADIIVIAVKPKDAREALLRWASAARSDTLWISVVAGLSIQTIQEAVGSSSAVIRCMPNTSSQINLGMTGLSATEHIHSSQRQFASQLFAAIGDICWVDEEQLHAITAVSGSGPAYVYAFVEAMTDGAVALGLEYKVARQLAEQTLYGAANMLIQTKKPAAELRQQVTSPNGTTAAALLKMEELGLQNVLLKGIARAAERSRELQQ